MVKSAKLGLNANYIEPKRRKLSGLLSITLRLPWLKTLGRVYLETIFN